MTILVRIFFVSIKNTNFYYSPKSGLFGVKFSNFSGQIWDLSKIFWFLWNKKNFGSELSLKIKLVLFFGDRSCLFSVFWFSPYDDGVEEAKTMRAPPTSNAIVIGEEIFDMCSSLTKIRDPVSSRRLFCLTDPFLWNECM